MSRPNGDVEKLEVISDAVKAQIVEARNRQDLNAFISFCSDTDVDDYLKDLDPSLPLAGMVFSAKDNIMSIDFPTTAGSSLLADYRPSHDADIVARFKAAGAFLAGKNNMSEFCQSMTCNNANHGPVGNPINKDWIAGGSSGGSAAAVSAGLVSFAIGTDTGGSVGIPAALCGCVGYRPTIGRYSNEGLIPVSPSFDTPGLLTRSVDDLALLDSIISQSEESYDVNFEQLRLGLPVNGFFKDLDIESEKLVCSQIEKYKSLGIKLIEIDLSGAQALNADVGFPIAFYEMLRELAIFFATEGLSISVAEMLKTVKGPTEKQAMMSQLNENAISREQYVAAVQLNWPKFVAMMDDVIDEKQLDAIVVPTTNIPAIDHRPLGQDTLLDDKSGQPVFLKYIQNTELFSNYGGPSISMPIGATPEGRPVGLSFTARRQNDRALMSICHNIEKYSHGV